LVKDLFNAMLVASSNNSAVALARSTGFSQEEFASLMNNKALELGMNDSSFVEPTGLDPQNVSTAADIIKLAEAALDRPEITDATSQSEYTFSVLNTDRTYTLENTDRLLNSYLDIKSGKTGYLDEAGYCLVSNVRGSGGQEVLVAVLGSESEESRFQEVKALAQWSYDNYIWPNEMINNE
jgi:D-alanyl-D-alanine carboxypeptidase